MRYLLNCVGYLVGNADIAEAAFDIDMSLSGIKNKNCIPPCLQLFNDMSSDENIASKYEIYVF
jgi:hypothetical protein